MAEIPPPPPPDIQNNGGGAGGNNHPAPAKRQRKPSVRLGEIGGGGDLIPPQESRRLPKSNFKHPTQKPRPSPNPTHQDKIPKKPPPPKRARTNWPNVDDDDDVNDDGDGGVNHEVQFREFSREISGSPENSLENNNDGNNNRVVSIGVRVSDGVETNGVSDTDGKNNATRNGVKVWLNQLGLGRYAPFFEIHEVDDEVLPMLTLEDLKEMGITAVGSRRKMYCSIQKLNRGFS